VQESLLKETRQDGTAFSATSTFLRSATVEASVNPVMKPSRTQRGTTSTRTAAHDNHVQFSDGRLARRSVSLPRRQRNDTEEEDQRWG